MYKARPSLVAITSPNKNKSIHTQTERRIGIQTRTYLEIYIYIYASQEVLAFAFWTFDFVRRNLDAFLLSVCAKMNFI